jgi:GAF domain-containing protein
VHESRELIRFAYGKGLKCRVAWFDKHHAIWISAGGGMSDDDESRLRALLRLAREVTARHDLDDVLAEAFRELRSVVAFDAGSIQLIDDDGWITVAACDPSVPTDALEARVPLGNSVAGRVVLTEQAIYVPDAHADGRPVLLPATEWTDRVRSYLAVPLLADGRAIGLMRIDDARPDAFDAEDRMMIVASGVVVAAAIQNARAQARANASRARADSLDRRLDQMRELLRKAELTSMSDQQIRALLLLLEQELGEAHAAIEVTEKPRVTL